MNDDHRERFPEEIAENLEAYFDGQIGDTELEARIENAVHENAQCRDGVHALGVLREQVRALPRAEAPPYLRAKVAHLLSVELETPAQSHRLLVRRIALALAVAASLLLTAELVGRGVLWNGANPHLPLVDAEAFVADHISYVPHSPEQELRPSDSAQLERWLDARLAFSPKLPHWDWAQPRSGRPCTVRGNLVALVRYRCGDEDFSLFIKPAPETSSSPSSGHVPEVLRSIERHDVAVWRENGLEYVVVAASEMHSVIDRVTTN